MAKETALPALGEVYGRTWKDCVSLWPLLVVQFLFSLFNAGAFLFSVLLLFGPLIAKYGDLLVHDPQAIDKVQLASDWLAKFSDPAWVTLLVGVVFLYLTWWLLLSAVVEGGVLKSFWRYHESQAPFDPAFFVKEGLRIFGPMILLQFLLSLYGLGLFAVLLGMGLLLGGFLALFHFNVALTLLASFFLGVPLFLLWSAACLAFVVYSFTAKARLTRGVSPRTAMEKAFEDCKANGWRILKGGMLVFLVYLGAAIALHVTLAIFALIPLIGILFALLRVLLGTLLAVFLETGLPALSVRFVAEREVQP